MDSTTIESKVAEVVKQITEEEVLQETREAFADYDAKWSKQHEEFSGLMGKLDEQIKKEKAAAREKERKEAISKAIQEVDDKYRHEDLDPSWLSLLNSLK